MEEILDTLFKLIGLAAVIAVAVARSSATKKKKEAQRARPAPVGTPAREHPPAQAWSAPPAAFSAGYAPPAVQPAPIAPPPPPALPEDPPMPDMAQEIPAGAGGAYDAARLRRMVVQREILSRRGESRR